MFKHYLVSAIRSLYKYKMFSLLNIIGLAIGMAASWIIFLYVIHEQSFDKYNVNADRIFRITQHAEWDGGKYDIALTARPFAEAFKREFPEVEEAVRIEPNAGGTIIYENKKIQDDKIFYADSSFFRVFTHHFLFGDSSALNRPKSIVLTKSIANTLFGSAQQALGKIISIDGGDGEEITGIIEDVPANSHFTFDGLRSMRQAKGAWGSDKLYTYILLHRNSSIQQLELKIPAFFDKYLKSVMEGAKYKIELQPLTSIHLHSNLDYEIQPNGNINFIILFLIIAALLLIIASVNYVNLTTARVSSRLKEIGIRKASGSTRAQLAWMFFSESILITFFAALIAAVIVQFCMQWFLHLIDNSQGTWKPKIWQTLVLCGVFTVIVIIASGIYPAVFLSGFKMIPSLKGQMGESASNNRFRELLVGFQLFTTITMIAASSIIFQQLHYVNKKDLGFGKTNLIVFHLDSWDARNKIELVKRSLLEDHLIKSVCSASSYLGDNKIGELGYGVQSPNGKLSGHENLANIFFVDEDFLNTLQIKLKEGRNFSKTLLTDSKNSVLINQTLAEKEGWKDAIGKKIALGTDSVGNPKWFQVIGVLKDFHLFSLQHKIEPLILKLPSSNGNKENVYVRISATNTQAALQHIADVYKQFNPTTTFDFHFVDETYDKQYRSEKIQSRLLVAFTLLIIIISCLGLFGLISFEAEKRRKEIGIRKVLGSSVSSIVLLLNKGFFRLAIIAFLIAAPIVWLIMNRWLNNFAYHINIKLWTLLAAGIVTALIVFLTTSVHTISAALTSPVKSLRTE